MLKPDAAPNVIRVFVASPEDVAPEREILGRVIGELNETLETFELPLKMELRRWETHTWPAAGRAQDAINEQIGDYDVFVGIMWRRFGTPTRKHSSGTEEEYSRAYKRWSARGEPHMMFYFSNAPAPPPRSAVEAKQLLRVAQFKTTIGEQNYFAEYEGPRDFETKVRHHLHGVLRKFWQDAKTSSRKVDAVVKKGRAAIREAINRMPPRMPDSEPPEPERLRAEEVRALRALITASQQTRELNIRKEEGRWRKQPSHQAGPQPRSRSLRRKSD